MQTTIRSFPVRATLSALALLASLAACGGGGGGPSSDTLQAKGSAGGAQVLNNKIRLEMPLETQMEMVAFANDANKYFGEMPQSAHLHVENAGLTLDISNSAGGLQFFQEAFTGDVNIKLKPNSGTDPGIAIATVKKPTGNGKVNADVTYDQKMLDTLLDDVLASTDGAKIVAVVEGPTNWNNAEIKKIGLIVTFKLSASK